MKEKIKTFCLIIITITILATAWHGWILVDKLMQKDKLYLNAYKECIEISGSSYGCIGILNGRSSQ